MNEDKEVLDELTRMWEADYYRTTNAAINKQAEEEYQREWQRQFEDADDQC